MQALKKSNTTFPDALYGLSSFSLDDKNMTHGSLMVNHSEQTSKSFDPSDSINLL